MAASASEVALVGPETMRRLAPISAATMQGTMLVYRPQVGGRPASAAKAMPCGSTISAPMKPAMPSSRRLRRSTSPAQSPSQRDACAVRAGGSA